jgi:hypothetical protein
MIRRRLKTLRLQWNRWTPLILVPVLAAAFGGYGLGHSRTSTKAEADRVRSEAEASAERAAFRTSRDSSWHRAYGQGLRTGTKAGQLRGERKGRKKGTVVAQRRAAQADVAAASPCPPGEQLLMQTGTQYCGRPGPSRPQDCPAGWAPVGVTGACAPKPDATHEQICSFSPDQPECLP